MSKESDNWDDFAIDKEIAEAPPPEPPEAVDEPAQTVAEPARRADRTGVRWSLVVGLVLIAAITILAAQNTQRVSMHFLGWDGRAPLVAIILGTGVVAVVIDEAVGFFWRRGRRKTMAEREELRQLRSGRPSD